VLIGKKIVVSILYRKKRSKCIQAVKIDRAGKDLQSNEKTFANYLYELTILFSHSKLEELLVPDFNCTVKAKYSTDDIGLNWQGSKNELRELENFVKICKICYFTTV
jgi:hypothetical protein